MPQAPFYQADSFLCGGVEQSLTDDYKHSKIPLNRARGQPSKFYAETRLVGVKSVPALVLGRQTFNIKFGSALVD